MTADHVAGALPWLVAFAVIAFLAILGRLSFHLDRELAERDADEALERARRQWAASIDRYEDCTEPDYRMQPRRRVGAREGRRGHALAVP
jgi:hypothetical protein